MKKIACYEVFREAAYAFLVIPIWEGYLCISTGLDGEGILFVPKAAIDCVKKLASDA